MRIFAIFSAVAVFCLSGCSDPVEMAIYDWRTLQATLAEAQHADQLEKRGEGDDARYHAANESKPYTGWVKTVDENGELRMLAQYENGQKHGLYTDWYNNDRMQRQGSYKNGKKDGSWFEWDETDQETATNYVDGEPVEP